ncbi:MULTISPECIES: FAD-dependent oxidoreductase [Vitreoscilla]|uniref:FAD-dependent oxidoreductase n=1 Tax=Vitreoscilla stercoraria TaxID=61 RepID=A0ABY4EBS0_VITST|nr:MULTISPECIES: FAD-dependent oxidoreductase [Vitreoscilla]AUZ04120.2 NADH oxidase [Vitreoscilla sp. C1]UOO93187.1 FAD-dependent oxidoreductase [Vitreoscilla stercoraria]
MSSSLTHLFEPLKIRHLSIKNRIFSTGHDTTMPTDGTINERLLAYHQARIDGGVGMIVLQVSGVHESARYTTHLLMATDDGCVEGYRKMAQMCHEQDCAVVGQIFHPGREIMEAGEGLLAVAYSASAVPNERFHVMPKPLNQKMIDEISAGYVQAARYMHEAGMDGVEFVASHGYLPAQFMNTQVNLREDQYGGSLENRLRFSVDILQAIREATSDDFIIGMRISADEQDASGLAADEVLQITQALEPHLDYVNLTLGTSASLGGAMHIAPPMAFKAGYVAEQTKIFKDHLNIPVLIAGRINQPQDANVIIEKGQADMCGMTRALICDPKMPQKAADNQFDDIRACIGCNQACIGHFHKGQPISCIQHPQTGREQQYGQLAQAQQTKKVMVIGGGPAGMKAALIAAQRGHQVSLYEQASQLGGQALLAQNLSRRSEFGGLITNLKQALSHQDVSIHLNTPVDAALIQAQQPDEVLLATGAVPYERALEAQDDSVQRLNAWQYLQGASLKGKSVLITDWRCDWIAPGIAESLVKQGFDVTVAINGLCLGETLPLYVRDDLSATAHRLGIRLLHNSRLYGFDAGTVYLQHNTSAEAIELEGIDSIITCDGHVAKDELGEVLEDMGIPLYRLGDCNTPRTAEEAIYEGLKYAAMI